MCLLLLPLRRVGRGRVHHHRLVHCFLDQQRFLHQSLPHPSLQKEKTHLLFLIDQNAKDICTFSSTISRREDLPRPSGVLMRRLRAVRSRRDLRSLSKRASKSIGTAKTQKNFTQTVLESLVTVFQIDLTHCGVSL